MSFLEYPLALATDFPSFARLQMHAKMVEDVARTRALERAIHEVVVPGDRVLDVGAGTGILSLFAQRAGASKLIAVEASSMARHLEKSLPGATVINDRLENVSLDTPVDVAVMEVLGHIGVDEGIVDVAATVRERLLVEGGRLIPSRVQIVAWPVWAPAFEREVAGYWKSQPFGVDFSYLSEETRRIPYLTSLGVAQNLAAPQVVFDLELGHRQPVRGSTTFEGLLDSPMNGMLLTFTALLSPSIQIVGTETTQWRPLFLPALEVTRVGADTELRFSIEFETSGFTWSIT